MNFKSLFVLYQYAEYIFAQCLRRQAQSNITNKVSCLSGCNQILRVSEETCGEKILSVFNYFPKETDDIFKHIRSYASEDRNHVCNMLSLYPNVQTTQTLKAISYTVVPTSVSVFLSQRRRWNLGANTNDMLLIFLPGINIFERILALVNVSTFTMTPFVVVATVYFVIAIITNPTELMLYLSIILFIPLFYSFLIPLFIKPSSFKDTLYYYLSFLFFISFGSLVGLTTFTYATLKMDIIKWGKTRLIAEGEDIKANISKANISKANVSKANVSKANVSETLNEELRIVSFKTECTEDNHILNFDIIV
jgi:chitin synthase